MGAALSRELVEEEIAIFLGNLYGQMTVRDSRKFAKKFGEEKRRRQISANFPKIIAAIFRQAIEGSKFAEKFAKFPSHWPKY